MVNAETPVTFTMKQLIIFLGTISGVVIAVGGILYSTLHDDVKGIRNSIDGLQLTDKEMLNRARDAEVKLTEQIGGLRTDLATFSGKFDSAVTRFEGSVNNLTNRMDKFQMDLIVIQSAWTDPKRISEFAEALKKQGVTDQPIVIVPLR